MTTIKPAGLEVLTEGVKLLTEAMIGREPKASDAERVMANMNYVCNEADDDLRIAFDHVRACLEDVLQKGSIKAGKAAMAMSIAGDLLETAGISVEV